MSAPDSVGKWGVSGDVLDRALDAAYADPRWSNGHLYPEGWADFEDGLKLAAPIIAEAAYRAGRQAGLAEARDRYEVLSDEQLGAVARRLAYFDGVNEAEWQEQASTRKKYGDYADEIVDTFLRVTASASPVKGGGSDAAE